MDEETGELYKDHSELLEAQVTKMRQAIETLTAEAMESSEEHMQYLEHKGLVDDYRAWVMAYRAAKAGAHTPQCHDCENRACAAWRG
jgi:hypothetical protein